MTRRSVFSKLDSKTPTNQFNWSARHKEILAEYKANPFQHALALKPDENANASLPILATDITDKSLTSTQEKWLTRINELCVKTDDDFAETIQSCVEGWYDLDKQCKEEEDTCYRDAGLAYLSTYHFSKIIPHQLFPRLSLSKKISLFAVQRLYGSLLSIPIDYQCTLRYIQAFIHQLKTDDPHAYQDLYQRHHTFHPEILPIFFFADTPYLQESLHCSPLIHGCSSDDSDRAVRALFLHHTDSSHAQVFTQAYHAAIDSPDYKVDDILLPLLHFIASCEQASAPERIVNLLEKYQLKQKNNTHLFEVLEDFDHSLYLEWLIEHKDYLEVSNPLRSWVNRYPTLTINKLIAELDANHQKLMSFPDFSVMTKREIDDDHSIRIQKKDFDKLSIEYNYLIQLLTHLCADLKRTKPEQVAQLQSAIATQNYIYYDAVIAPILFKADQVEIADHSIPIEQQLTDEYLAQVSKWLITPPWAHQEHCLHTPRSTEHIVVDWLTRKHRLQIFRLPEHIVIDLLPKPIFKSDGSELPLPLFENLIGILYESDFNGWPKPLTDDDMLSLLTPFTRDSLNALGHALWNLKIGHPWGWLMNEDAVPFIHAYIYEHKSIYEYKAEEIHGDSCALLILMLVANVKLWYSVNDSSKGLEFSTHVCSALAELFYQIDRSKAFFRDIAKAGCVEISDMTGYALYELRHLIIPTLGFNDISEQIFYLDAAAEKWLIVRLDSHLSPLLYDQTGTPLKSFPRAKKGDDKTRFKQVNKDIKALQRPLATLYKRLNTEFTKDLAHGFKRSVRFMLNGLLQHPILRLYGQTLFWSLVTPKQFNRKKPNIIDTFIMTEDQVLMNVHYEPYSDKQIQQWLDEGYTVVLTHPDYLSVADYEAACEMLTDYGIAQPIKQIRLARCSQ